MRIKPLPPAPESLETLTKKQRAIPLVPASETDCCSRLIERVNVPSRDQARTWISFLEAIGFITKQTHGYARTNKDYTKDELGITFLETVYGASELREIIKQSKPPVSLSEITTEMTRYEPHWERQKQHGTGSDSWDARTQRLLNWLVLLDQLEHTPTGYALTHPVSK